MGILGKRKRPAEAGQGESHADGAGPEAPVRPGGAAAHTIRFQNTRRAEKSRAKSRGKAAENSG